MNLPELGTGVVLGFGSTNARFAVAEGGDIHGFHKEGTPKQPDEFFRWMGRHIYEAAHAGHSWVVAGFPGPVAVTEAGTYLGPMTNVGGMSDKSYDLLKGLDEVDPAISQLLAEGFKLVNVNDGALAAQAAAHTMGEGKYGVVAALINGTGLGLGIARQDAINKLVFRVDKQKLELGHMAYVLEPYVSLEDTISGTAITRVTGKDPRDVSSLDPMWHKVGTVMGRESINIALMNDVELVVFTGGVGIGASPKYRPHLEKVLSDARLNGKPIVKNNIPDIRFVDPKLCDSFEMSGAQGVMLDHLTRAAA